MNPPDYSLIGPRLALQLFLIVINAVFAAAEIAVVSLNDNKIRRLSKEGDKKATKMLKMLDNPSAFLSTIQIAITLSGFLASAFASDYFADMIVYFLVETCKINSLPADVMHLISVIIITLILSYFTLIFGELVPKRIAMKKSEQIARGISGLMRSMAVIFKPVVWLLSISTNGVLRLFGINPHDDDEPVSEDEIRMMIDIGEEKGTIASAEKEMIENIFEFNNTTAGDIMTHRTDMSVIWADETNEEILHKIIETGYSRFPVCGEDIDQVIGVVRTREFLLNLRGENPKSLIDLATTAYFVPLTVRADILFHNMQSKKYHMAIIVDEFGGTSGLVTMEDLLEEIVGNIYDESDTQTAQEIKKIADNQWLISGSAAIEDIEEALEITINDDDDDTYTTLGGLIFSQLNQIPDDGTHPEVTVKGLRIIIEKIQERRVEWAYVSVLFPEKVNENNKNDED
jgi:putative hemolysin